LLLKIISNNFSLRKVDWLSLLTHDLVDDFASHLKIYRKSKERVQENKVKQNKYDISVDELESAFFDIELGKFKTKKILFYDWYRNGKKLLPRFGFDIAVMRAL
jgi:hypothetical protein